MEQFQGDIIVSHPVRPRGCKQVLPNPGLYLNHGGTIGLPLSGRDAQAIIAASHQAPFERGEQTTVDKSVRKT